MPSTASFDRLLPAAKAISLAQAGQRRDPCPKPPGIWRKSDKRILGTDAAGRPLLGHFAISGEAEKRWLANEHLEVVPVPPSKAWTGDDIALLLRQYGPLCVSWFKTAKGSTYGHVSVIVGYDESSKEVIIHDPENRPRWRQKLADFNKTFMWGDPRPLVRRSGPAMQQRALTDLPPIGPLLPTSP